MYLLEIDSETIKIPETEYQSNIEEADERIFEKRAE